MKFSNMYLILHSTQFLVNINIACLYTFLMFYIDVPLSPASDSGSDNEFEDVDTPITEMRFAPDNTNNLETMFQAMNQCQVLHPDPQDSFSDGR